MNTTSILAVLNTNRSNLTKHEVVRNIFVRELENMVAFGGNEYNSYRTFRKAVLTQSVTQTELPMKLNVAALMFNGIRNKINELSKEGIELNGNTYTDFVLERKQISATEETVIEPEVQPVKIVVTEVVETPATIVKESTVWLIVNKVTNEIVGTGESRRKAQAVKQADEKVIKSEDYSA